MAPSLSRVPSEVAGAPDVLADRGRQLSGRVEPLLVAQVRRGLGEVRAIEVDDALPVRLEEHRAFEALEERRGDIVVQGAVGARTGIDQKGGTIIVGGDAGSSTAFMMQRGRQIILGDVGPGLGDSMYDGEIYVGGTVKSLGIDCVPGEWTDADTELIERKFRIYGLGSPPEFQKFVCGKVLYNYDNLEPSEKKLVIH